MRGKSVEILSSGSTCPGWGIIAVWSVFTRESGIEGDMYIYTDSYVVFKGCTEWVPFREQNHCEANRVSLWQ